MPIAGDYTWTETRETVNVTVNLKGTRKVNVHVQISDVYLKLNYAPYLVTIDLLEPVDFVNSVARFQDGQCVVIMNKVTPKLWKALQLKADKKEIRARRADSLKRKQVKEEELRKRKSDKAIDDDRLALRKHMEVEEHERGEIEGIKAEEKSQAEEDVYRTLAAVEREAAEARSGKGKGKRKGKGKKSGRKALGDRDTVGAAHPDGDDIDVEEEELAEGEEKRAPEPFYESPAARARAEAAAAAADAILREEEEREAAEAAAAASSAKADIFVDEDGNLPGEAESEEEDEEEEEEDVEYVPPPRETVVHEQTFTSRVFPTPLRESKTAEEERWVEKNRAGLERSGRLKPRDGEDRDISERDPVWLKGRGDDFFRAGDFRSAVNAYTAAIEIEPGLTACISNRAACRLRLGALEECVADCNLALSMLSIPPGAELLPEYRGVIAERAAAIEAGLGGDSDPSTGAPGALSPLWEKADEKARRMVVKLLVRRGTARCQEGQYERALLDYQVAHNAEPADHLLHADVRRVQRLVRCGTIKAEGDAAFRLGSFDDAIDRFTEALAVEPTFVSCFSNRAAAYLSSARYKECVDDCTSALQLLDPAGETAAQAARDALGAAVASGSDTAVAEAESAGAGADTKTGAAAAPSGPIPPPGSKKHTDWVLKTVVRRGTALVHAGLLQQALVDFDRAAALDPENAALKKDAKRLRKAIKKEAEARAATADGAVGAAATPAPVQD